MPTPHVRSEGNHDIVYEPVCQLCDDGHVKLATVHATSEARTWLGLSLEEGRQVVLKGTRWHNSATSERNVLEYELARMLDVRRYNTTNTPQPLDLAVDSTGGKLFLVEEYIGKGECPQNLDTWVTGRKAELIDTRAVATDSLFFAIFAGIAHALDDVHKTGCAYADLKGPNVIVSGGRPTLIDFGSCRRPENTALPSSSGTLAYMSPEQFLNKVNLESDTYSLGVCLYEALTDALPYPPSELRKYYEGQLPKVFLEPLAHHVCELNPLVHPDLAALIHDCLFVLPEMRPSMGVIKDTLRGFAKKYGGVNANTRTAA